VRFVEFIKICPRTGTDCSRHSSGTANWEPDVELRECLRRASSGPPRRLPKITKWSVKRGHAPARLGRITAPEPPDRIEEWPIVAHHHVCAGPEGSSSKKEVILSVSLSVQDIISVEFPMTLAQPPAQKEYPLAKLISAGESNVLCWIQFLSDLEVSMRRVGLAYQSS